MSLRLRLVLLFLVAAFVPFGALGLVVRDTFVHDLVEDHRRRLDSRTESLRRRLDETLEADARVAESLSAPDVGSVSALLAEAEAELMAANVYIPFGVPLRWSLVRGNVEGFEPNIWGVHPLSALALVPR